MILPKYWTLRYNLWLDFSFFLFEVDRACRGFFFWDFSFAFISFYFLSLYLGVHAHIGGAKR